jgi:RNA polymerase sigma-70 factor (ECF subfamily)
LLQPTALVNEAWVKLSGGQWKSKTHFLALAGHAMRLILVDATRARMAAKRNGGVEPVTIDEKVQVVSGDMTMGAEELLDLDRAMEKLSTVSERKAQVVEMRFFGGMEFPEIAEALEVSLVTVKRDWSYARTWLFRELSGA